MSHPDSQLRHWYTCQSQTYPLKKIHVSQRKKRQIYHIQNPNIKTITGTIRAPPPIPTKPQKNPNINPHNTSAFTESFFSLRAIISFAGNIRMASSNVTTPNITVKNLPVSCDAVHTPQKLQPPPSTELQPFCCVPMRHSKPSVSPL